MDKEKANLLKAYNMLLYFAGSMIIKEPSEECVIDFWERGALKNLPLKSSNPRFIKAASVLRESCSEKGLCRKSLAEDFFRLFDEKGLRLTPARESEYTKKENNTFSHIETADEFYRSYGWNRDQLMKLPSDHLGIELLFLTRLTEKLINIDDDPSRREMKNEIRRFIDQHILSWIPEWNEEIQRIAYTSCYKGISTLIYACVEDIYIMLSS